MTGSAQQYCLRWNNHRSNLLTVFDELLQNEAFTDVTLACDGGTSVKCHKMVLAACSPYFQTLFTELPCRHPVVVLKDVKYTEIKAILEYMYRGEVNVAQDQLAALLKVAEALKVKGLVEESRSPSSHDEDTRSQLPSHPRPPQEHSPPRHHHPHHHLQHSPPGGATSTSGGVQSAAHSSSGGGSLSPPHSTASNGPIQYNSAKNHYYASKPPSMDRNASRLGLPMWAVPGMPLGHPPSQGHHPHTAATTAMLGGCYDAAATAPSPDMSPLKRKKLSSLLMNRDTPILRTVLGQGHGGQMIPQPLAAADSSQPVSLVCHPDSHEGMYSNGSAHDSEKNVKNEPSEDAQSPYTDISMMDEDDKGKVGIPSSSPLSFSGGGVSSGIATYVPQQKPEWKRYKQYTRNDIMSAIEAVRNGMSALQAARKYGVPSRTLYDKVKKLGITTSRPFKRGSNGGGSACFPYGLSGTSSPYGGHASEADDPGTAAHTALLEASFLQHAGEVGAGEREALAAMAAAAAHHAAAAAAAAAAANSSSSPGSGASLLLHRSPSPKYMRQGSLTPSPAASGDHHHSETNGSSERDRDEEDDMGRHLHHHHHDGGGGHSGSSDQEHEQDQVEDLSVTRKAPPEVPQSRVIMPPMNQVSAIVKKDDSMVLKEHVVVREDTRRELSNVDDLIE